MEKAHLLRHLKLARQNAEEGSSRIVAQKRLIALLDQRGQDTSEALTVLSKFEEEQNSRLADLNRLLNELDDGPTLYPLR
jgi:hypothetical protein